MARTIPLLVAAAIMTLFLGNASASFSFCAADPGGTCSAHSDCCPYSQGFYSCLAEGTTGKKTCQRKLLCSDCYCVPGILDCCNGKTCTGPVLLELWGWKIRTCKDPGTEGDPIFTGFDGSVFSFMGQPNKVFNLLSERNHQINALFTPAIMFDHNGTYITEFGIKFFEQRVAVAVNGDTGAVSVILNGKRLSLPRDQVMTHTLVDEHDVSKKVCVTYERYRPGVGWAVDINTPTVAFSINSVAPSIDAGGVAQPAYLNSKLNLLAPPVSKMSGLIGSTFNNVGSDASSQAVGDPVEVTTVEYAVSELFADDFAGNQYNMKHGRSLMELGAAVTSIVGVHAAGSTRLL